MTIRKINPLVYALVCPVSKEIRYVGKSKYGTERAYAHLQESAYHKDDTHKNCWIRSLVRDSLLPEVVILSYHATDEEAYAAEVDYIRLYKKLGANLTNATDGGKGTAGFTITGGKRNPQKPRIGNSNPFYGRTHTAATVEKLRTAKLGKRMSEATRRTMSAKQCILQRDPELRRRMAEKTSKPIRVFNDMYSYEFTAIKDVVAIGLNPASVCNCLKGRIKSSKVKGYKVEYINRGITL